MNSFSPSVRVWLFAVLFLFTAGRAVAQITDLKGPARELFERGLAPAQQQAWELAINHFTLAYEHDNQAPPHVESHSRA